MEGDRTLRMFQTNFQVVFLSMVLIILTDDNVSAISGTYFGKAIKSAATVKTIRSFAGVSIEECADECRRRAHCQYVDYLNRFKVCYIFNTTDPNEDFRRLYQNRTGSIVGVKTEWMSKTKPTADPASLSECGQPEDICNATRKGNIYNKGGKVSFACANSSDLKFSTCTANKTWEPVSLTCTGEQNNGCWVNGCSWYVLVNKTMSWMEAKEKCGEQHGHLAHITSYALQESFKLHLENLSAVRHMVKNTNSSVKGIYIGADDQWEEGKFRWSNGSLVLNVNWADGEPNPESTFAETEDCVIMDPNREYRWADVGCNKTFMAICEYEIPCSDIV